MYPTAVAEAVLKGKHPCLEAPLIVLPALNQRYGSLTTTKRGLAESDNVNDSPDHLATQRHAASRKQSYGASRRITQHLNTEV